MKTFFPLHRRRETCFWFNKTEKKTIFNNNNEKTIFEQEYFYVFVQDAHSFIHCNVRYIKWNKFK